MTAAQRQETIGALERAEEHIRQAATILRGIRDLDRHAPGVLVLACTEADILIADIGRARDNYLAREVEA